MANISTAPIQITPVTSYRDTRRFIQLPQSIYADCPEWRPPLNLERHLHLSSRFNPTLEHLNWQAWLAWQNGTPVGRITAQIDQLREPIHGDRVGYFGMLEAFDDPGIFSGLLTTAETWLRQRGMQEVHGPFNLTINDECGLLVDGFDTPPMIMMGHSRPYYQPHVEAAGYGKARDTLAYWIDVAFDHPRAMQRLEQRYADRLHVRAIDRARYDEELETLREIFNDAWADNWGFVPLTRAEFQDMGHTLKFLIDDDLVQIAEYDGQPAAFIVCMPNLNEAIRDLQGRLTPARIARLIWRVRVNFPDTTRVPLMGVKKAHQGGPLGAALAFSVISAVQKPVHARGATGCELSWILEDNKAMRDIIENLGATPYKTYRIYRKSL